MIRDNYVMKEIEKKVLDMIDKKDNVFKDLLPHNYPTLPTMSRVPSRMSALS